MKCVKAILSAPSPHAHYANRHSRIAHSCKFKATGVVSNNDCRRKLLVSTLGIYDIQHILINNLPVLQGRTVGQAGAQAVERPCVDILNWCVDKAMHFY